MIRIAVLSIVIILAACSGQPAQTNHFLLRSDVQLQTRELQPSVDFAIASVTVADYINNPGLVVETADGEVREARNNRWAEPLASSVRAFLAQEISAQRGEDIQFKPDTTTATRIDIAIDQLHGNTEGEALLVAYWQLRPVQGDSRTFQFAETEALAADGYPALAAAEKRLLQRLALQIAGSLSPTE